MQLRLIFSSTLLQWCSHHCESGQTDQWCCALVFPQKHVSCSWNTTAQHNSDLHTRRRPT